MITRKTSEPKTDGQEKDLLPIALSVARYAKLTSQGISTVYRQIAEGSVPAHQHERRILIMVEEVLPILRTLPFVANRGRKPQAKVPYGR